MPSTTSLVAVGLIFALVFGLVIWLATKHSNNTSKNYSTISVPMGSFRSQRQRTMAPSPYLGPTPSPNTGLTPGATPDPSPVPGQGDCKDMFPPPPTTLPDSAYSKMLMPKILTSAENPVKKPSMGFDKDGNMIYTSDAICATPSDLRVLFNDGCAQYGIGETVAGPEGNQRCVCVAERKPGKEGVPQSELTPADVVIGFEGVCTSDDQCCTNYCANAMGQFSKMCTCPPGMFYNDVTKKCYVNENFVYQPQEPPKEVCPPDSHGKKCKSNADCYKGQGCVGDGFCVCMLSTPKGPWENKINFGGNCDTDDECLRGFVCAPDNLGNKVCKCPPELFHNPNTYNCECPNSKEIYVSSLNKCVSPEDYPRKTCPTKYNVDYVCSTNSDCGLGEYCLPGQQKCVCAAYDMPFSQLIGQGGRCDEGVQCMSKRCSRAKDGLTYCE